MHVLTSLLSVGDQGQNQGQHHDTKIDDHRHLVDLAHLAEKNTQETEFERYNSSAHLP